MNWINSWKKGNKKETIYNISIRFGRITVLEIKLCLCEAKKCARFRFMIFNLGFEF